MTSDQTCTWQQICNRTCFETPSDKKLTLHSRMLACLFATTLAGSALTRPTHCGIGMTATRCRTAQDRRQRSWKHFALLGPRNPCLQDWRLQDGNGQQVCRLHTCSLHFAGTHWLSCCVQSSRTAVADSCAACVGACDD